MGVCYVVVLSATGFLLNWLFCLGVGLWCVVYNYWLWFVYYGIAMVGLVFVDYVFVSVVDCVFNCGGLWFACLLFIDCGVWTCIVCVAFNFVMFRVYVVCLLFTMSVCFTCRLWLSECVLVVVLLCCVNSVVCDYLYIDVSSWVLLFCLVVL